ncbi:hypothetical protein Q6332_27990, partial [Klebsiella pneumoniae]|uniref:ATP-binding cassette domain-containing protein n=1 Tax=Klebsiella pneumoniae TaxID=573 RepID=UPI0027669AA5|nr:hypothetical protein [Klebsiella pneumoniae]
MSREILKVENLSMRFGGLLAVNGVALTVKEKQVVALIGPNGAGKTRCTTLSPMPARHRPRPCIP